MKSLNDLKEKLNGRRVVIMGAGPSLPGQFFRFERLLHDAVLVSINQRPARTVRCDFIVFLDENTKPQIQGLPGERISPFDHCTDYRIEDHVWRGGFSAHMAAYLACWCGAALVVLMGFDLYQGDREYFDSNPGAARLASGSSLPLRTQLMDWRLTRAKCPDPYRIKAAGGPLSEIFGEYHGV